MSSDDHLLLYRRAGTGLPKRELRQFATILRHKVAHGKQFTCLLTDDRELERLNRMFFGLDYPTDVLSFPCAGDDSLGELAISVPRAAAQALEHEHSTADEIRILMLHGVLHLLGMDHEIDRGAMAKAEERWRVHLDLPNGLIKRTSARPVLRQPA